MRICRSFLCVLLAFTLVLALFPASIATAAENGEYEYELFNSQSRARILKYIGEGGDVVIPDEIEGATVVEIRDSAFDGNATVTSVTMGDTVIEIGEFVFRGCSALKEIRLSETLRVIGRESFKGCAALEEIRIPDSVEALMLHVNAGLSQGGMFEGCHSLHTAVIGERVRFVPIYAFRDCISLKNVTIGGNVEQILYYAFENCTALETVAIPDSVTTIEAGAFKSCTALRSVDFGGGLKMLASEVFYNCKSLKEIVLPDGLEHTDHILGLRGVFEACTSLERVNLGKGLQNIADRMFYDCSSLVSVAFGDRVTMLGAYSFYRCNALRAIRLPDTVEEIGAHAFEECEDLERIDFGAGLKVIRSEAFRRCVSLRNIDLPNSLELMEHEEFHRGIFQECTALKRVIIGNGIETVSERIFWGCIALEEVVIGRNVETIEDYAFWSCNSLKKVYFQGDMPQCDAQTNPVVFSDATVYHLPERTGFPENAVSNTSFAKITFDANGGVTRLHDGTTAEVYVRYTQNGWTSEPGIPYREGYTFLGWIRENDTHGHLDFNCCKFYEDTTLHAHWEKNTYRILFDPRGGYAGETGRYVAYGDPVGQFPVPDLEGNEFLGWYYMTEDGEQEMKPGIDTMPACDLVLYAKWAEETELCTVIFDVDSESFYFYEPVVLAPGETLSRPSDPYKEGYDFVGWYTDPGYTERFLFDETAVEGNMTLYALFNASGELLPPLPPCGLKIEQLDANSATVSWDADYLVGTTYRLYLNDLCISDHGISDTEFTISGLEPETEYTLWVTALNELGESGPSTLSFTTTVNCYTVSWNVDGKVTMEEYKAGTVPSFKGDTAKADDQLFSYTFVGWSPELAPVTADVTYTAVYSRTIKTTTPDNRFADVPQNAWFYREVYAADGLKLMGGVSQTEFAPNDSMTRAMLVTVLWRMEGSPAPTATNPFTDIPDGQWYSDAVIWAAENGIVNGVTATEFAPNNPITREQIATILYRYTKAKGYDVSASADLAQFPDASRISAYAYDALSWAVAEKLVGGSTENGITYLNPQGNAIRAQVAAIIVRYVANILA